jgi:hypothetical protein
MNNQVKVKQQTEVISKNTRITYQVEGLNALNEWVNWDHRETSYKEVAVKNMKYLATLPTRAREFRLVKVETLITKTVEIE